MTNIEYTVEPGRNGSPTLVIKVDLTQRHGPSSTGKTIIVASSEGALRVPGHREIQFGLNVYTKSGGGDPP